MGLRCRSTRISCRAGKTWYYRKIRRWRLGLERRTRGRLRSLSRRTGETDVIFATAGICGTQRRGWARGSLKAPHTGLPKIAVGVLAGLPHVVVGRHVTHLVAHYVEQMLLGCYPYNIDANRWLGVVE